MSTINAMCGTKTYKPTDKMSDLICENYALLQVLSRFGVSLGFGDKSVREVCEMNGVDCPTFLAVVNFLTEDSNRIQDHIPSLSVPALMSYLQQAHSYFLDFQLPAIRKKLIEAIDCSTKNEVAFLILQFYDDYVSEVRNHMEYENEKVFAYVNNLLAGKKSDEYNIGVFARHHDRVNDKLTELKNIIIKYYPANGDNQLLNATLFDIFSCEEDLASHNRVEDYLFVPAIMELEKEVK
ncbi:hemerythrin domain-containing protein [uncultured Bacteroides sp.]|uniref:hemerythrin domain-containing protein n=1 Tax=uncultured Bacteroides sp. TaxID=162156 RepID=UPI00262BDE79|nr:hemerythrin domain-containing protein [uncultured Bacteroides sp.]